MIELDVLSAAHLAADADAQAAADQAPTWRSRATRSAAPAPGEFQDPVTAADAGTSRRTFLKVMGASAALAGVTGCRRPVETILPYARKPEEVIPGVPNYYATAMTLGGVGRALLVQSHEGRPTKVEGNPEHPVSQGATDIFAQASVLQLYDPDRSRRVWVRGDNSPGVADWGAFVAQAGQLRQRPGRTVVLAEPSASPTVDALRDRFVAATGAEWITLGPMLDDPQALGTQRALGQPARPLVRFSDAEVVVSFDGDFLAADDPNSVWNNREYAASRRVDERGSMSRMYVVESTMTMTGGMADHRRAVKAATVPFVAAAVAQGLGVATGARSVAGGAMQPFVDAIVADVRAASGRAAFVAGHTQPPEVHALVAALNGRFGAGVSEYLATGEGTVAPVGPRLAQLVRDMNAGQVGTLLMLGTNPVYALPAELEFEQAMLRVPTSIHVGLYRDETGQRATWHIPRAHYLESWGDARAYDGTLSIVQPLIEPLFDDAHSDLEVLNTLATGRNNAGYDLLRQRLRGALPGDFETAWRTAIHDGFVEGTRFASLGAGGGAADLSALAPPPADGLELVVRPSPTLYDGQFSNVSWMQEAPHPVTKVTWDPVALVSPRTAVRLGLDDAGRFEPGPNDAGDMFEGTPVEKGKNHARVVRLATASGGVVELPVWVQPGHPDESVTAFLGYGRALATERVIEEGNVLARVNQWLRPGHVATDVYQNGALSSLAGHDLPGGPAAARAERCRPLAGGAVTAITGVQELADDYLLASTQDHGNMEGRAIVRVGTVAEYTADPEFAKLRDHYVEDTPWENFEPLWGEENAASEDPRIGEWIYSDNQWGMTIDLNACTGCNACVVACQSENNVPVVGKDQVARGREMHWLRLDRYYVGADESDPGVVPQPMMCVHCENAPCEQVCPVNATAHSPDGLNEMTYNRCIGTRYCANNCPYKVRRYNYYNWTKTLPLEVQMQSNPYVTVRYRGVMEKCTFCVQRIRQTQKYAHITQGNTSTAELEGALARADEVANDSLERPIPDGTLQTACQQVCPAQAIVFGDLRDPNASVTRSKESPRNYAVLAELAVKPRLTYLARLRNPNPDLVDTRFDVEGAHGAATHAEPAV